MAVIVADDTTNTGYSDNKNRINRVKNDLNIREYALKTKPKEISEVYKVLITNAKEIYSNDPQTLKTEGLKR